MDKGKFMSNLREVFMGVVIYHVFLIFYDYWKGSFPPDWTQILFEIVIITIVVTSILTLISIYKSKKSSEVEMDQ